MAEKERHEIDLFLRAHVPEMNEAVARLVERSLSMKQYEDSGSVEGEELQISLELGRSLRDNLNPECRLSFLKSYVLCPENRKQKKLTLDQMRDMKTDLLQNMANTKAANKVLDRYEAKFKKYNLPKRGSCESFKPYSARVRDFMRATWREPAEERRRKEYKCLMEWTVELDRSGRAERIEASQTLRKVLVDTGIEISRYLVEYLWMISVFADSGEMGERLLEVDTVIRCLSIDPEGSVVIEAFASVVEFFHRTMRMSKGPEPGSSHEESKGKSAKAEEGSSGKEGLWSEKETEVFRLIVMEILRLEVSFRSPDLPMILPSEMYIAMGDHLMKYVFKDKLEAISTKIEHLKTESRRQSITDFFEEIFNWELKNTWNSLDLDGPDEH